MNPQAAPHTPAGQESPFGTVTPPAGENTGAAEALLDLSGMEPPRSLDQVRLEELTIDGICGVY
ncbi:MAG: mycofactocin precursor MftA [Deltaproteobacteria bacterium]|nr:mycofactocin precursor MftA [Deltaproteobacteria bacterium]